MMICHTILVHFTPVLDVTVTGPHFLNLLYRQTKKPHKLAKPGRNLFFGWCL